MINKPLQTITLCSLIALQGCTMAPDYARPNLPVADRWSSYSVEAMAAKQQPAVNWQDFFQSLQLQKLIQAALDNNRDLRIAALNVQAAQALYRIERADSLPSLSAGVEGVRQNIPEKASITGREYVSSSYAANVSTSYELDLFGRLKSSNDAALATYFATESARDAVQIAMIAETANAYLQWLSERKILQLTEETLAAQQKSHELISKSYAMGVGSKLDVAQISTAVETASANKALYSRRVAQDENALRLLIGLENSDALLSDAQTLDDLALPMEIPVGLPSTVLLERPDIKQAEFELKSSYANIGAARAAFFPSISLTGSTGFASSSLSSLFSGGAAGAWGFSPQINVPIFDGGFNLAKLKYSQVERDIAVAKYEKSIQNAFREVSDELAALETLSDELEARRQLVNATQEAYDLSSARYKQGIDSFLNVLDAQRSLFTAQQSVIETQRQVFANRVNLYKVLGGGVS